MDGSESLHSHNGLKVFFPYKIRHLGFELMFAFKEVSTACECLGFSVKVNQEISVMLSKN